MEQQDGTPVRHMQAEGMRRGTVLCGPVVRGVSRNATLLGRFDSKAQV